MFLSFFKKRVKSPPTKAAKTAPRRPASPAAGRPGVQTARSPVQSQRIAPAAAQSPRPAASASAVRTMPVSSRAVGKAPSDGSGSVQPTRMPVANTAGVPQTLSEVRLTRTQAYELIERQQRQINDQRTQLERQRGHLEALSRMALRSACALDFIDPGNPLAHQQRDYLVKIGAMEVSHARLLDVGHAADASVLAP